MDDTHVQAVKEPAVAVPNVAAVPTPPPTRSMRKSGIVGLLSKGLQRIASLRLTVVLFAFSIVLVFAGTLAQVDSGVWTVVDDYFRSAYVWIPLQIFFPRTLKIGGGFPYPGGWLLGGLLLTNLLAAHAVRFKLSWKRTGIVVLHAGLIVMMLGELITGKFAVEGSMLIYEGQSSNYVHQPRVTELAVMSDGPGETAEYAVVPMQLLRKSGGTIKNDALPFDVEVVQYMVNSRLCKQAGPAEFLPSLAEELPLAPAGVKNPATAGMGAKFYVGIEQAETSGVDNNKEDQPAAYVRFRHKTSGQDLGTYFFPLLLQDEPQHVNVDGKKYDVRLRFKRTYKDYAIQLHEFRHDVYVGTTVAKNFSSRITLVDPAQGVNREVLISMNDPLRYGGETFYQQSFQTVMGKKATILQVVRNPGWMLPYISCIMVAIGMLLHFGIRLVSFLGRRASL